MIIKKQIQIKSTTIWLAIDQLRVYTEDMKSIEEKEEFLCYYNLSEPTIMIYGELFKDENGRPKLFKSINEAIEYSMEYLTNKNL